MAGDARREHDHEDREHDGREQPPVRHRQGRKLHVANSGDTTVTGVCRLLLA
jgi:hypothetical protein